MLLRCRASGFRTASGSLACHARAGVPRRAHRQLFTPTLHALQRKQCVPYSSEQVYAVVADVERYAEFLPFCSASRICARHGPASFDATLTLGFLAFCETYTSRVTLEPPRSVTAVATDTNLFSHLSTRWRLADGREPGTCELHFVLEMQLKSILQDQALQRVMDRVVEQQVAAFRKRCDDLYCDQRLGTPEPGAPAHRPPASALPPPPTPTPTPTPTPAPPTRTTTAAAAVAAAAALADPRKPPPPPVGQQYTLQIDPAWRHPVEAAYEAHATQDGLSLRGFVEAGRAANPNPNPNPSPDL